jgi:spore coat protein H
VLRSLSFVLLCLPLLVFSQSLNPARGRVYNDAVIPSVYISIASDSLAKLYKAGNECSDHEYPVTMIWKDGVFANDTVYNVGMRFKGNTSRMAKKKSFKLSFETFKPGRKFHGAEKLNLNGEHNDPSIIREKLFWDAAYTNNSPALRCNYIKLFVNGAYYGLYINVEDLDENFVRSRFGNDDGNLYKCYYGADLTYKGASGNSYKTSGIFCNKVQRVYELQSNKAADNYQGLADFINALNNLPLDSNYAFRIKKYFNVEGYLKMLALEVASGHWDNYASNNNNFFLYENTYTGQVEYITYDADNTFGIGWTGDDWGTVNVHQFNGGKNRPLYSRLLAIPEFKNKYDYFLNQIITTVYDTAVIFPRIDSLHTMIWAPAIADTARTKDYGFTVGQFHNSFSQTIGVTHVKYGLKPFFVARTKSIGQQIGHSNIIPYMLNEKHTPFVAAFTHTFTFRVAAYDDESPLAVRLHYSFDPLTGFRDTLMYDDGLHGDGMGGDKIYGIELPPHAVVDTLVFYYTATSITSQVSRYPAIDNLIVPIGVKSPWSLRINELMAKNSNVIKDEFNEYDDWLELYNNGNVTVNLGSFYLSHAVTNPVKNKLPSVSLPPGSFVLIWCDNQNHQGPFHANFKLSASGEWVGVFDENGLIIDSVSYLSSSDNVSIGCVSDGTGPVSVLTNRTPGYTNSGKNYGIGAMPKDARMRVYPNPARAELHIANAMYKPVTMILADAWGRELNRLSVAEGETTIDISQLAPGVYILEFPGSDVQDMLFTKTD